MKIELNRTAFAEALSLAASVVPARTPKPILRCVQLTAEKSAVTISATDLEVGINCIVSEVSVIKEGKAVVPADMLSAIVRESSDDVLLLEANEGKCEIKGTDSHFNILGQEANQYPQVPHFDGEADLEIQLSAIQAAIKQSLFATAKESTRYALSGVLWEVKGKKMSLVATDGRRLARVRANLNSAASEKISSSKLIVPAKTMALVERMGAEEKEIVAVKIIDNQIVMRCANVVISSNLVEGNFPKYEDIIPKDYDVKIVLQTEATLSAVRRASLLTSEESRGIRVSIEKGKITFSGKAPEAGDAIIKMAIDYSGGSVEIGFNPQFIIDALRVLDEQEFEMELGGPDRPGLIKSGSKFMYVLMPINLG
ncbi:MAG: DNA polymerase III subunit beta [Sedimentisphaerales bacterium]|nr:DNA polymerase III subunit beta [Sedimentisphaerales bacterium]